MIRNYFLETLESIDAAPPPGWVKGHVTLMLIHHPDERIAVEAWRHGCFAVHPAAKGHAVITHAPTGHSIWTARSMKEGAAIVEGIEPMADWSEIKPGSQPELRDRCRKVIDEIEAALGGSSG